MLAIRAALGAPSVHLRRQLPAENLVLSILGGALGVVLAVAGLSLLIAYAGRFTTRTGEIAVDGWVLGLTTIVALAMAMLFAWAPRLTFIADPVRAMASGGGRATGNIGRRRAQRALVVSQLAVSFTLLIAAGLLMRTLLSLYAVDPGFNLSNGHAAAHRPYVPADRSPAVADRHDSQRVDGALLLQGSESHRASRELEAVQRHMDDAR